MTAFPTWLLPDAGILQCDEVVAGATDRTRTLYLRTIQPTAPCPQCQHLSRRVHSRSTRALADVPLAGIQIMIVLRSRRFFCDQSACTQQIFTERLPSVVPPRGRRTDRLTATHQRLALALGGNGGDRPRYGGWPRSPDQGYSRAAAPKHDQRHRDQDRRLGHAQRPDLWHDCGRSGNPSPAGSVAGPECRHGGRLAG